MIASFTVVDAPAAGHGLAGFARAVARRFVARLPLVAALVIVCFGSSRLSHLGPKVLGLMQYRELPDAWRSMLMARTIFVLVVAIAVLAADEAVARGARRGRAYVAAVLGGCMVAMIFSTAAHNWAGWEEVEGLPWDVLAVMPLKECIEAIIFTTFGTFVYVNERTARLAVQRMRSAELGRAAARRRTIESRLQAMQARVEPQFLFNTLARVRDLSDRAPAAGDRMLDELIAYLRAALPHLRESTSTLVREVELVRAYLGIVRDEQGGAGFESDVRADLAHAHVPAMTLLPLVDLALAHRSGIGEPEAAAARVLRLVAGVSTSRSVLEPDATPVRMSTPLAGHVPTRAPDHVDAGILSVTITDTAGGRWNADEHAAAAIVDERLRGLFGDAGRVALALTREGRPVIRMEIPHDIAPLRDR